MPQCLIRRVLILSMLMCSPALAWHDATHMAVMQAAGLGDYTYLAVGADMAKDKAGGHEEGNHYCNNARGSSVTADMVLDQVRDYNCRCEGRGHLYGAIVASLNQYRDARNAGKYARYPLGFAAHYIADLSQPFHNVDFNDFNRANHGANDGVVEGEQGETTEARVRRIAQGIGTRLEKIPPYRLPRAKTDLNGFNQALAQKIAEIANRSVALGYAMQDATPPRTVMTVDEAYGRLAESAALLRAAYEALQ